MYARDLKRQLRPLRVYVYATAYVYRQGLLLWHAYIDLCRVISGMTLVALKSGKVMLPDAHNHFAVVLAATRALDTVLAGEAKREQLRRLLSFGHA